MNFIVEIKLVRHAVRCWKGMCHCNPRMHQSRLATPVDVPYWKFVVWVEVKYKITVGVSIAIHEVEILAIGPVTLRVDVIGQADRKEAQIQVRSKVSGVDRGSVPSVLVVENPEGLGRVVLNVLHDCFRLGAICLHVSDFDMCFGCEQIVNVDFHWCVFGDIGVSIFEVELAVYLIWLIFTVIDGVCTIGGTGIG